MEDELLERAAALGHHEQPTRLASSDEGLLDGPAAGHDLVAGVDEGGLGRFEAGPAEGGRTFPVDPRPVAAGAGRPRTARAISAG